MSEIVARNGPAVVNISVSSTVRGQNFGFPDIDPNDPFYEFFRHFRVPQPRGERQVRGQGSGFLVREDGIILTNAHVISEADEVVVRLNDKREFKAKVLGADKGSDVAVLKIEASGLPTVKIGESADTRVGEWVLAIGSPYGFESSATAGIVSAKSRSLPADNYVPFIQTDVAVNPGNSGGPLFNMAGEVIGINSQIYSRTGGYQGLSFAIPIDVAVSIQDQILKYGKVQRGRLGVSIQEVNPSLAESFGLSKPTGALISSVEKGSPAAQAGLEPGDVILSVNGREIGSSSELPPIIAGIRPGDSAKLQIWRKSKKQEIKIKVGGVDPDEANADDPENGPFKLGLSLRTLRPEESRRLDGRGGLLVESVSGAAARAGIRAGDVVLSVNGEPVNSTEQLRALVAKASKRVALLIQRGEATLFVPVDLG
jgi:serine protease Do